MSEAPRSWPILTHEQYERQKRKDSTKKPSKARSWAMAKLEADEREKPPPPHTLDLPGRWKVDDTRITPHILFAKDCPCYHWTPEPHYGDTCPNCGAAWTKWQP